MIDNKATRLALEFVQAVQGGNSLVTPVSYEAPGLARNLWPIQSAHAIVQAGPYTIIFERRDPVVEKGIDYIFEVAAGGSISEEDAEDGRLTALRELYEEANFEQHNLGAGDIRVTHSEIYTFRHDARIPENQHCGPLLYAMLRVEMDEILGFFLERNHSGNEEVRGLHLVDTEQLLNSSWELYPKIIPFQQKHFLGKNVHLFH